jgi:hypothetical protein
MTNVGNSFFRYTVPVYFIITMENTNIQTLFNTRDVCCLFLYNLRSHSVCHTLCVM